jgi:sec-independent protein translocase protein TatC
MAATPALPNAPGEQAPKRRSVFTYIQAFRRLRQRAARPGAMTILEHLEELRLRVTKAGIALAVTTSVSFIYSAQLVDFLTEPIGGKAALASIEVTENISIFMRVALLAGVALGLPLVLYQGVAYIAPGLTTRERRWLHLLIPVASIFFLAGAAFAWFIMLPVTLPFLINFLGIPTHPRPQNYVSFVTSLLFWVGVSFEMPLVVFFLAKLKWVTAGQLLRGWRYALVGIATLAALVTPTVDPVNMGIVSLPLVVLYFLSIILARIA